MFVCVVADYAILATLLDQIKDQKQAVNSPFAPSSLELSPAILHSSAVGTKLLMRQREREREGAVKGSCGYELL